MIEWWFKIFCLLGKRIVQETIYMQMSRFHFIHLRKRNTLYKICTAIKVVDSGNNNPPTKIISTRF